MITFDELNPRNSVLTGEQFDNIVELHLRMNKVRDAYAKPMIVTSGFRSIEDHRRIYMEIARRKGISNIRIPMGSRHLSAQAVDIYDPKGKLKAWIAQNVPLMEEIGLWFESFDHTPTWVHFQIVPPRSGRRFFIP